MTRTSIRLVLKGLIVLTAAVVFHCLSAGVAAAQQNSRCAQWAQVRDALASAAEEAPVGQGPESHGLRIILFTTRDGSTWTLVVLRPDGVACLVGEGTGWEPIEFTLPEPGRPL